MPEPSVATTRKPRAKKITVQQSVPPVVVPEAPPVVEPVEPVAPVAPVVPVAPVAPVAPDVPVVPVAPVVPDAPDAPDVPDAPVDQCPVDQCPVVSSDVVDELMRFVHGELERLRTLTSQNSSFAELKQAQLRNYRMLVKYTKAVRTVVHKLSKNQKPKRKEHTADSATVLNSGLLKPVPISLEMSSFGNWVPGELKSRRDVTKCVCDYIKEHNLQNPQDRRIILLDDTLRKLLRYTDNTVPLTYYRIQSCLKHHFV